MKYALGLLIALAVVAPARAEPTARRVWLLCQMEDPGCFPAMEAAFDAFLDNPTWTECYSQNFGHGGVFDAARKCWKTTTRCEIIRSPHITNAEIFRWYMIAVQQNPILWTMPARIGMYQAMREDGRCHD